MGTMEMEERGGERVGHGGEERREEGERERDRGREMKGEWERERERGQSLSQKQDECDHRLDCNQIT